MKRWLKIAALVASHLVVVAAAAAVTSGYWIGAEFRRAQADPLTRLGMRFDATPATLEAFPALAVDVRAAGARFGPATRQVLQLVGEVRSNDMTGATRTCTDLGWRDCEPATLFEMRKALVK